MKKVQVRQTGKTWSVFVDGVLHEGGFFGRRAAENCAHALRAETLIPVKDLHVCTPEECPTGSYYATILRDGRRLGLLLGPYNEHREALALVDRASHLAIQVDPFAAFDAFGTVAVLDGTRTPGVLNDLLKRDADAASRN